MKNFCFFLLAGLTMLCNVVIAQNKIITPKITAGPLKNPYKGWNTKWYDLPQPKYSTISALSFTWNEFETAQGVYDWDKMDKVMNDHGSAGGYININIMADRLKTKNHAPAYVYKRVKKVSKTWKGNLHTITDCNDPYFLERVGAFVKAFYTHYKDNPRIHAINMGFLGFYGEWSKHPFKCSEFCIEEDSKEFLIETFLKYSNRGFIGARYPKEKIINEKYKGERFSFSDGYFRPGHKHQLDFVKNMGDKWRFAPVGGETPPDITDQDWNNMFNKPLGLQILKDGHYSNMKGAFGHTTNNKYKAGFDKIARAIGYNFAIEKASYTATVAKDGKLNLDIKGKNQGTAPFYYDWDFEVGILANNATNAKPKSVSLNNAKTSGNVRKRGSLIEFSGKGSSLELPTVTVQKAGDYVFDFNYQNIGFWFFDVFVNGKKVRSNMRVTPNVKSGNSSYYSDHSVAFSLKAGSNSIKLVATNTFEGRLKIKSVNYKESPKNIEKQIIKLNSADVRKWMPGSSFSIKESIATKLPKGDYKLAFRLITKNGSSRSNNYHYDLLSRNAQVIFANDLPVIDSNWGSDAKFYGGWTVLGNVKIDTGNVKPPVTPTLPVVDQPVNEVKLNFEFPKQENFKPGSNVYVKINGDLATSAIKYMKLYINGKFIRQENRFPFEWNASNQNDPSLKNLRAGSYTLKAVATTKDNKTVEVSKKITVGNQVKIDTISITSASACGEERGNPAKNSIDKKDNTRWSNTQSLASACITYNFKQTKIQEVQLKLFKGNTRTYPIKIEAGNRVVFQGTTKTTNGYWSAKFPAVTASNLKISMTGKNSDRTSWFSIYETKIIGEVSSFNKAIAVSQLRKAIIYPNPATDQFTIEFLNEDAEDFTIEIFDLTGKLVHTKKISGNIEIIDVTSLSPEVYFIKIKETNQVLKIVKK